MISVAISLHKKILFLEQMETTTEKKTARYNVEINRFGGVHPQWIHLHHSAYIFGSRTSQKE